MKAFRLLLPLLLGSSLASPALVAAPASAPAMPAHVLTILHPMDAKFHAVPNAASCNTMVSLRGDMSKEAATFTSRMTPGCVAPWHWHSSTEEIVMLQGAARMQMETDKEKPITLPTGAYSQLPSNHLHRFKCLKGPDCVIMVITDRAFDIHWVDKSRKEIPFAEAVALDKAGGAW